MYSSFDETGLLANGWDSSAVPNSDGNPSTHLWSELLDDPDCPATEIKISGADVFYGYVESVHMILLLLTMLSLLTQYLICLCYYQHPYRTYDYFKEVVLPAEDADETFDTTRPTGYVNNEVDEVLVQYLADNEEAISYFGYSYFALNDQELHAAPIQNDAGNFISPTVVSVEDGSYNPLSRRIYMNILDSPSSLALTRPFLDFGLSSFGESLVQETGYFPIPELERIVMRTRAQTANGVPLSTIQETPCGPAGRDITIAGSSTVFPVANLWVSFLAFLHSICISQLTTNHCIHVATQGGIYEIGCGTKVEVKGGGSSIGADRVCGGGDGPVDIGNMSREWKDSEASVSGQVYSCLEHDTSRSAIQIPVAIDGLTVATNDGGVAKACVESLGGLNLHQLRWIYSSYSASKLEGTGWDSSSVANSDGNDATHLWSELSAECSATEILIAGADDLSGTYEYFLETVLTDHENGETFALGRPNGYRNSALDEDLVAYILDNNSAISYFGYAYYFANRDTLFSAPIQNSAGMMVKPTDSSVGDGSYEPLARRIYMNLHNDETAIEATAPFVKFGFSTEGRELVAATGYINIPDTERTEMISIIDAALPGGTVSWSSNGLSGGAIAGIVIAAVVVIAAIAYILMKKNESAKKTGKEMEGPVHNQPHMEDTENPSTNSNGDML